MTDLCRLIFWTLVDLMRARATLEAEIWVLRQQINVLRRAAPRRQSFGIFDRLIFVGLYRLFPKACDALAIVKPDTIIRWHRAGFRAYWRWKSRRRGGRPTVSPDIRKLIHEMSIANPLWGAPRIHGELLKLGIEIGQTRDGMAGRHSASDRRIDCKSDYGSMRLGTASPLSDPRLRSSLWHCLHPTTSIDGHSRPTNVATLPVAKWMCRTADRFDPTGMP